MSDLTTKAARGTVMHLGAQITLMGCSYLVTVLLARTLGPAELGVYGVIYSFLLAIELTGRLGIPQAAAKLVAELERPAPRLEATSLTLSALVYLTCFAAFWLLAPQLAALFNVPDGSRLFRIAALDIPFYGLYAALFHILNGRRRFLLESLSLVVYGIAKGVGVLVLVWLGPTIAGAFLLNVAVSIVALLACGWMVGRGPFRPTLAEAGPILRLALPIALMALGTQLLPSIDLWALSVFGTPHPAVETGYYVAASNIGRMPNFLANALTSVLIASVARALGSGDADLARRAVVGALRFLAIVLIPGCVLIAVNAAPIMTLLFSAAYAEGGEVLAVLIFAQGLFLTCFLTLCGVMVGAGHPRHAALLALAVPLPAFVLDGLLVTRYGAMGAAWGALLATAAATAAAASILHRRFGALIEPAVLARILLGTLAVAVPSWLAATEHLLVLVELALAALCYTALLPVLGLVRAADLRPFLPRRAGSGLR